MVFGIDVGGTTIKIGLVNSDAKIIDKWAIDTDKTNNGEHILSDIFNSIKEYCDSKNIDINSIEGYGFGIPGPIRDSYVFKTPNLPWNGKDIKEEFSALIPNDARVQAGNDATVAAAAELWVSGGKYRDLVIFTLGTGVGGGVVINGVPLDGFNGAGGEIGHMHIDDKYSFKCGCGNNGCLETVTSATGICNIFQYKYDKSKTSLPKEASAKDIFDAAKTGDSLAQEVTDEVCDYLGKAISLIAVILDPEVFVIGGGVSAAGEFLIKKIQKAYDKYSFYATKEVEIKRATLGNDAGIIGAAYLVK